LYKETHIYEEILLYKEILYGNILKIQEFPVHKKAQGLKGLSNLAVMVAFFETYAV